MRAITGVCLIFFTSAAAFGQPAPTPAFEVASIKPNTSGSGHSGSHSGHGLIQMDNVSLKQCIERAYDVRDYALSAPEWLDSVKFDITAKALSPDIRDREYGPLLQTLLVDRFKLAVHRESKVLSAYALVVGKNGPKLKEVEAGNGSSMDSHNTKLTAARTSMERLADFLARRLDRPVVDSTELKGVYYFTLEWAPEEKESKPDSQAGPSLFTALQEQLGLRLQPKKLPVEILVVDHAERAPTEN